MTSLPKVGVTRTEAGGYLITCSLCPMHRMIRQTRTDADAHASYHRASHSVPDEVA